MKKTVLYTCLCFALAACGGSDPAAPEGSVIYLTAEYTSADSTTGDFTANIRALVLNQDSGDPQRGVGVLFLVTEGPGRLNSGGKIIATNSDGEAFDVLIASGAKDGTFVTVTATSGNTTETIDLDVEGSSSTVSQKPRAAVTASLTSASVGQDVEFDVSGSTDADGVIQTWEVDYDDGTKGGPFQFGTTKKATHKFSRTGLFNVTVTVKDDDNLTDNESITVRVQ